MKYREIQPGTNERFRAVNYAKADIRNPLRYSVKRFFYLCCIP